MELRNSYLSLGDDFYQQTAPVSVASPQVLLWNNALAAQLNLAESLCENPSVFSGNTLLPESTPLALAYAGHQFGQFNPQLGDGRAHLLAEIHTDADTWLDIQLKGSGRTRFSRGGDGRCALGPAIREYVMSEAMAALGIATTRCLAVVTTGETVMRETTLPGAVVTRVAASHLRVGTFEYFYAQNNLDAVRKLSDYAIARHFPQLQELQGSERYRAFLRAVCAKQIALVCDWMRVGFIHGVMNTDNTAISGETIDFGPCAMMSRYNPNTVFSSIDAMGRYRFGHQPVIAQWNMARLAESLLPLLDEKMDVALEQGRAVIDDFSDQFQQQYLRMMAKKIGINNLVTEDKSLLDDLLERMRTKALDYTRTFDWLTRSLDSQAMTSELNTELGDWIVRWQARLATQNVPLATTVALMRRQNPVVIPRNHHMEQVIEQCLVSGTAAAAEDFLAVLRHPYEMRATTSRYQDSPQDGDRSYQTFCGT